MLQYVVKDVIDKILSKEVYKPTALDDSDIMPLKDRDFKDAVSVIKSNVVYNITRETSKPNFSILVSGGAPGIGMYDVHVIWLVLSSLFVHF